MTLDHDVTAGLRAWAEGSTTTRAAVELLVRAFGGRFASPSQPWVSWHETPDGKITGVALDVDVLDANLGGFSGGEARVLRVVISLLDTDRPVDLGDIATGLDHDNLALVLAAISQASGRHSTIRANADGTASLVDLPTLYPWPGELA